MDPKCSHTPSSFLFLSFFLLFSSATAFNITKLLGRHPEFKTFNDYLTQTQLAAEINRRQTITVLVVDDKALSSSSVSGKPTDVIKEVLSIHVVLDYFDVEKLQNLSNKTSLLTTLFQASGSANGQDGFLNVTDLSTGQVAFGSGEKGSTLGAKLVKLVEAQPCNISVLQISSVIVPAGIENKNSTPPSAAPKKSTPTPSKSPSIASPAKAPSADSAAPSGDAPSEADASTGAADVPSDAGAPESADAPPTGADAPESADVPLSSPPSPSAPAPKGKSSGTRVALGMSFAIIMGIVSSLAGF